ncbi:MAG: hypothetical protein ACP5I8_15710 [Phycisphaerae bacterium]
MMTFLWIVAAQPLLVAVIWAIRDRHRSSLSSTRQHPCQSRPGHYKSQTKFIRSLP